MYRIILFFLFISSGINSHAQFLRTKATAIVNEKNESIILRGMGLGGWMLQEGYMFRLSFLGQQYRIKEKIKDVVGEEKTKQFYEQWLLNHTTKKDIDAMAAWGFNSIRLPMHYNLYTLPVDEEPLKGQHTWIEKGFALTDSLLNWCKANKMYLVLDLHAAPGGQGNDLPISDRDPSKPSLWESEANKEKTIALWKKLAERYANEPWIGGYDIINEPNWGFEDPKNDVRGTAEKKNEPLRSLMIAITKAIREVDKKHIIIIEGNGFGNNYRGVLPAWDDNMVLSFHKYGNFNTDASIKTFLDLRDQYNMPLWLGESGENSNTWFTEAIALVEKHGIGWAWWQEKKMGINNPLEIMRPAGYDQLLNYWSGKGPKPTEAEAWNTLQEWLENSKIENNIYHPDVVDAMIRQVQVISTKPFKHHVIESNTTIQAVDFDMGRQRFAYYDKDSARYQYTPGVNTQGNRGNMYRNDGADIRTANDEVYVSDFETGEWLQYTVVVSNAGKYNVSFLTATDKDSSSLSLQQNKKTIIKELKLPVTGDMQNFQSSASTTVSLKKGTTVFRVLAAKGGFNFSAIQFTKTK
jgi:aryl-phospho-beta-D-glucosidase BglC (GH1 family)